ncbi:MAG: hypothetical protein KKE44_07760 [Proteobacteria bacterium]|nr:hypothetical protein [Pseudomonadota bacterium]MBU1582622.1 hypothetical protein [Pseudomonadota bacterium]MBU2453570.1 hypothetical protein [Pseudomonadota bacterium]MBU2630332.1 hypothetical protein [Pseudomonadota bacterium]
MMTTINQINESAQSFAASNTKVSKHQKKDAFGNALSKALDRTEAPEMEHTTTNALREIASKDLNIINASDIVSGKTDNLLAMLDSYSSKLEDPNISLKTIAPVVEEIKNSAGHLLKDTQNLTDADANLKKIATQTILTAQTEYVKFQRGDYLS